MTEPAQPPPSRGRRLLRAALVPRLRRVDIVVAVLLASLGFAAAVQVRSTQNDGVLASARQEDLVRILSDLTNRSERLRQEVNSLSDTERRLTTGTDRSAAALAEAQRRSQLLGVLAGTLTARGEGIILTITDPAGKITAGILLDALEELRDAGAEAVQVEGPVTAPARASAPIGTPASPQPSTAAPARVRVVASTALLDGDGGVLVDGVLLRAPYRFTVIGDPATLSSAMGIPGGVADTVSRLQGRATVTGRALVDVAAVRALTPPRYARADPTSSPGS